MLGADVAIINGGGIRAPAGDSNPATGAFGGTTLVILLSGAAVLTISNKRR